MCHAVAKLIVVLSCVSACFQVAFGEPHGRHEEHLAPSRAVYRWQIRCMMLSDMGLGRYSQQWKLVTRTRKHTVIMKWEEITKWHGVYEDLNDDRGHGDSMRNTCSALMFVWYLVTVGLLESEVGRGMYSKSRNFVVSLVCPSALSRILVLMPPHCHPQTPAGDWLVPKGFCSHGNRKWRRKYDSAVSSLLGNVIWYNKQHILMQWFWVDHLLARWYAFRCLAARVTAAKKGHIRGGKVAPARIYESLTPQESQHLTLTWRHRNRSEDRSHHCILVICKVLLNCPRCWLLSSTFE